MTVFAIPPWQIARIESRSLSAKMRLMAEKSVAQKLGLKRGNTLLVLHAPLPVTQILGKLPEGAALTEGGSGPFPIILLFVKDRAALLRELPVARAKLQNTGALWVAFAKGTSKRATDINRDSIREYVETEGFRTVSIIGIDKDWSSLRLKLAEASV
jgi:hypothetical protein